MTEPEVGTREGWLSEPATYGNRWVRPLRAVRGDAHDRPRRHRVVSAAFPSIKRDLGFSQSSLAWVVDAYLIAFGGLLLLAGRLGDLVSRRGVFLAGVGVFAVACGMRGDRGPHEAVRGGRRWPTLGTRRPFSGLGSGRRDDRNRLQPDQRHGR